MDKKKLFVAGAAGLLLLTSLFTSTPSKQETNNDTRATSFNNFNQLLGLSSDIQEEILEESDSSSDCILVIPIKGTIGASNGEYDHELILNTIDKIKEDTRIKAVLLSIDSPGGGVYETSEVYDKMKTVLNDLEIPVYVSMGSMAASGGYYLSMLGEKIYAANETVTGSIGVIMSGYNTKGLLEKLGVEPVVFKSADMKDIMSSSRDMTDKEKEVLQAYVDESFQRFVNVIVDGRQMSEAEVRKLADGRVYSGSQAKEAGLIDAIGYEADALAALREAYQLEEAKVITYTSNKANLGGFWPSLLGQFGGSTNTPIHQLNEAIDKLESLDQLKLEYRLQGGY